MNLQPSHPAAWQPPPNYHPVPSALKGVTVYAPQMEKPSGAAVFPVTYKCPQCGATTRYDVAAGGVACEHCGYTATPEVEQVGRRAEEYEFTLETIEQSQQGWGVERQELHCDSCGAFITLPGEALTATCPFCSSHQVNVRPAPSDILRPRFLIPFKVQNDTLRQRASEWLGKGWFHPAELSASAVLDRFTGIYLPFWTFDAEIDSTWEAEVGHERHERYYDAHSKEWKTRTVIDWRWENGEVTIRIDDLLVSGSSRVSRLILERLLPYNLNELVTYLPDYLAGWQAQAYDVTLMDAWEEAKDRMREKAREVCRNGIHSSHVRNFRMTADFGEEVWRYVLLPVYLAAYQFEGKIYQVMVNGQTGTVAGQKPVAWWKIWLAIAALLLPGVGVGLVGLPLLLVGGAGMVFLVIGFILLVIGGIISFKIYQQAVSSEAA